MLLEMSAEYFWVITFSLGILFMFKYNMLIE